MNKTFFLLSLLALVHLAAFDDSIHEKNKRIFSKVVESKLKTSMSPQQAASYLSAQLPSIAREAIEEGFNPYIYSYGQGTNRPGLYYKAYEIWEGGREQVPVISAEIPLSMFIYVWPPENLALKTNPQNNLYGSNIHSHPIPCAFTVLFGTITQETYQNNPLRKVRAETIKSGEFRIDEGKVGFIHRLVCQSQGSLPAITLHAYGAASAEKLDQIFSETSKECTYR